GIYSVARRQVPARRQRPPAGTAFLDYSVFCAAVFCAPFLAFSSPIFALHFGSVSGLRFGTPSVFSLRLRVPFRDSVSGLPPFSASVFEFRFGTPFRGSLRFQLASQSSVSGLCFPAPIITGGRGTIRFQKHIDFIGRSSGIS